MSAEENSPKLHNTPQLTHASVLLSKILAMGNIGEKQDRFALFSNFEKLFGKHLAEHLKITDLKDGILFIKASNSVWKNEALYQKKAIIDRCNGLLGAPRVKGIRFIS